MPTTSILKHNSALFIYSLQKFSFLYFLLIGSLNTLSQAAEKSSLLQLDSCQAGLTNLRFPGEADHLPRGFVTAHKDEFDQLAPETQKALVWWRSPIYIATSIESARAHHLNWAKKVQTHLIQGFYLINDKKIDHSFITDENSVDKLRAYFNEAYEKSGLVYFDSLGNVYKVDDAIFKERFHLEKLSVAEDILQDEDFRYVIFQNGWHYQKQTGLRHMVSVANSSTFKKIQSKMKQLLEGGNSISFNTDDSSHFADVLKMLSTQKRKLSAESANRFSDPSVLKSLEKAFEEKEVMSVEIRDSQKNLIGGILVYIAGNIYESGTIYYINDEGYKIPGTKLSSIEAPKIAGLALMIQLFKFGRDFLDAGMVTSYSYNLKTFIVSKVTYDRMSALQSSKAVVFPSALTKETALTNDGKSNLKDEFMLPKVEETESFKIMKDDPFYQQMLKDE
jgi:hypothetical protein